MKGWLGELMASGFGTIEATMSHVRSTRKLVEKGGVSIKAVMGAKREAAHRAFEMYGQGEDIEAIKATLAA